MTGLSGERWSLIDVPMKGGAGELSLFELLAIYHPGVTLSKESVSEEYTFGFLRRPSIEM